MNCDLEIQRIASRTASVLAVPAWAGFIYTFAHRPQDVSFGGARAPMPEVGVLTVATLFVCLLCFACALPRLRDDVSSLSTWLFVAVCAVPFFGMLALLDPFGVTPWIS